jgi:4-hydroxybenzoate polyprenyl transferase
LIVAHRGWPSWQNLLLFAAGALMLRSLGCAYNDWVDRDIDAQVVRTRARPLAAKVLSVSALLPWAFFFLAVAGVCWLFLSVAAKVASLVAAFLLLPYPWLKRVTHWPQAYLGVLFSSGVIVAWLQVQSTLPLGVWLLFVSGAVWTLYYDTLYAFQDAEDDARLRLGSTALLWHKRPRVFLGVCIALTLIFLGAAGWSLGLSTRFFMGLAGVAAHFAWQLDLFDPKQPATCRRTFLMNQTTGGLIALSLLAGFWVW